SARTSSRRFAKRIEARRDYALRVPAQAGTRLAQYLWSAQHFPQKLVGLHHPLQPRLEAAVSTVAIGVIAPDQLGVAPPQRLAVRVERQAEDIERAAFLGAQDSPVGPRGRLRRASVCPR